MKLLDSDLEKIKKKYNYLVDQTLDFDLKIGQARRILDIIFENFKKGPNIEKEFKVEMMAQRKRFAEKKNQKSYAPYEDPIKDSFDGWLNFFVLKKSIPQYLQSSFSIIYKEVSGSIHENEVSEQMFPGIIARLNDIIIWLFQKNEKPVDFLKEVKLSDEIYSDQKIKNKPSNSSKRKYTTITSLFLIGVFALFYFLELYPSSTESGKIHSIKELQKNKIDSTKENNTAKTKKDTLNSDFYSLKKQDLNVNNQKLKSKPSINKSDIVKIDNNRYILVNTQDNSEEIDPALLSKIIEKYKDQYEFITDKTASSKPTGFEFRTNIKVEYKASQYTEGIISCTFSFSYQIINNSDKSIVKNHSSEASGIGHSNNLAKQNAIQKLKI